MNEVAKPDIFAQLVLSFAYPLAQSLVFKPQKDEVTRLVDSQQGQRLIVGNRETKEWIVVTSTQNGFNEKHAENAFCLSVDSASNRRLVASSILQTKILRLPIVGKI